MSFWSYFILFFFPLFGGSLGLLIREQKPKQLKLYLAFSGAFLFSISAISLTPEVYKADLPINVGYFVLVGFFLQIIVDLFSKGVEHGHLHFHEIKKIPYGVFAALCLHALLEGMASGTEIFGQGTHNNFVFGIALHEIPAAFALITILKMSKIKKKYLYSWVFLYAFMTPIGAAFSSLVLNTYLDKDVLIYLVAVVIGVFLHISTTILFENTEDHKFSRYKLIAVSIGIAIALISVNFHIH
jgi:zinc and cadmium transporter